MGGTIPRTPNHCGEAKRSNNVASTLFNAVHFLPNDLRFEYGGAELTLCPGRHLTSFRPCEGEPLDFEIRHFSITFLAKKVVFLVSVRKIKFRHF